MREIGPLVYGNNYEAVIQRKNLLSRQMTCSRCGSTKREQSAMDHWMDTHGDAEIVNVEL